MSFFSIDNIGVRMITYESEEKEEKKENDSSKSNVMSESMFKTRQILLSE